MIVERTKHLDESLCGLEEGESVDSWNERNVDVGLHQCSSVRGIIHPFVGTDRGQGVKVGGHGVRREREQSSVSNRSLKNGSQSLPFPQLIMHWCTDSYDHVQIMKMFTNLFQRNSVFVGSVFVGESFVHLLESIESSLTLLHSLSS